MQIDKSKLLLEAAKIGIPDHKAEELWDALSQTSSPDFSKFDLSHVLYYLGAMIVIIAMGWFVGIGWESFGGAGLLAIAGTYILIFTILGSIFWRREGLQVPGGLFITIAVCLIPLAVYGFQRLTGWWIVDEPGQYKDFVSWVRGGWFLMEVATIIGGCIALYFFRFPFLTAPIFFSLWFMSMDATPFLFGEKGNLDNARIWVSLWFGLALLILSFIIDRRTYEDFAFWGYLFGTLAFWAGLTLLESTSEFKNFLYFLVNVGLILLSVLLQRTVLLIFGALGVICYISSLFYRYFSDSTLFPFILSLIGVLVVFLGIMYRKHRQKIEAFILGLLPQGVLEWLPRSRKF